MSLRQRTKRNSYGSDSNPYLSLHDFDCDSNGVLVRWRINDSIKDQFSRRAASGWYQIRIGASDARGFSIWNWLSIDVGAFQWFRSSAKSSELHNTEIILHTMHLFSRDMCNSSTSFPAVAFNGRYKLLLLIVASIQEGLYKYRHLQYRSYLWLCIY